MYIYSHFHIIKLFYISLLFIDFKEFRHEKGMKTRFQHANINYFQQYFYFLWPLSFWKNVTLHCYMGQDAGVRLRIKTIKN